MKEVIPGKVSLINNFLRRLGTVFAEGFQSQPESCFARELGITWRRALS